MFITKIDERLDSALNFGGIVVPTETQNTVVPAIRSGSDLICISPDGTGKSTAIVIAVIHKLKEPLNEVPRALIIVNDNDSAKLMKAQFDAFSREFDLRVFSVTADRKLQHIKDEIYSGADVVIGTPKRLAELYSNSGLNTSDLKLFVVDEAQRVLRDSGVVLVNRLAEGLKKAQFLLFASKETEQMNTFAEIFLKNTQYFEFEEQ